MKWLHVAYCTYLLFKMLSEVINVHHKTLDFIFIIKVGVGFVFFSDFIVKS